MGHLLISREGSAQGHSQVQLTNKNTSLVVGIVAAVAVIGLVTICGLFIWIRRKRKLNKDKDKDKDKDDEEGISFF